MVLSLNYKNIYSGKHDVEGAAKIRIVVDKNVLSLPYELEEESKILGEVVGVYEKGDYDKLEIPKIPIIFILKSATASADSLYMEKESWYKMRDYGIIPENFKIDVLLTYIALNGEKIEIFPKRAVEL